MKSWTRPWLPVIRSTTRAWRRTRKTFKTTKYEVKPKREQDRNDEEQPYPSIYQFPENPFPVHQEETLLLYIKCFSITNHPRVFTIHCNDCHPFLCIYLFRSGHSFSVFHFWSRLTYLVASPDGWLDDWQQTGEINTLNLQDWHI